MGRSAPPRLSPARRTANCSFYVLARLSLRSVLHGALMLAAIATLAASALLAGSVPFAGTARGSHLSAPLHPALGSNSALGCNSAHTPALTPALDPSTIGANSSKLDS